MLSGLKIAAGAIAGAIALGVYLHVSTASCGITVSKHASGGTLSGFTIIGSDIGVCVEGQAGGLSLTGNTFKRVELVAR